jgi:hypothetical protein
MFMPALKPPGNCWFCFHGNYWPSENCTEFFIRELGVVFHPYNPSYSGSGGRRIVNSRPAQKKIVVRLCLINKINNDNDKRAGDS